MAITALAQATPSIKRRIEVAALQLFAEHGSERINVKDLALKAGVSRGTIYNNVESLDTLFDDIVGSLAANLHERIHQSFAGITDPAHRLSIGIRLILRQVFRNPAWGQFLCRFGLTSAQLREVWQGQPMRDLEQGVASGRYTINAELLPSSTAMMAGTVIGAARLIIDGHRGWLDCGSEAAELVLRALGIDANEAHALARSELPEINFPSITEYNS